jgi:hypothetical protein
LVFFVVVVVAFDMEKERTEPNVTFFFPEGGNN